MTRIMEMINKFFNTANIRSIIAILVVVLSFGMFYKVVWDDHITVEKMSIITAIIGVDGIVLGYYYGSSKSEADKAKKEAEK